MDTHLTTIGSTLDAIARLHANAPSSSRNVFRPFTCAVLNTYKLDVLDYIRDADQVESNLFWYPPPPGGINGNKGESEKVEETVTPGVTTRLPEPKEFIPPTPLRKNVVEAEAKGLVQFDARTLLKAAQKLLENYHHAPRARKHIKALLKHNNELEKQMSQHESSISRTESLIAKLSHSELRKEIIASNSGKQKSSQNSGEEIRKLQDSIRREQMELLAIEQTTEDLLEKRQKALSQKARSHSIKGVNKAHQSSSRAGTASPSSRSGSVTPKPKTPTRKAAETKLSATGTRQNLQTTEPSPTKPEGQAAPSPQSSALADFDVEDEDDDEDLTVRRRPNVVEETQVDGADLEPSLALNEPESSDELERICENIWTLFGGNLRYVAVDREGADYRETLRILQKLSMGGASSGGEGDTSMASSSNESQGTAATSGSTNSLTSQLENAGPPSSTIAIAAHILFTLLTSPSPHAMEFDDLKAAGESWWISQGREALERSAVGREVPCDISDDSSSLASKAIYSLIAKKLLRLNLRVGKRIITFPAHIG